MSFEAIFLTGICLSFAAFTIGLAWVSMSNRPRR